MYFDLQRVYSRLLMTLLSWAHDMSRSLIYLDQNIVSAIASDNVTLKSGSELCWVYSKEHFAEIRRSSNPGKYLDALDRIDAKCLQLELVGCKITGNAFLIEDRKPSDLYCDYIDATGDYNAPETIFDPLLVWLNGGGDEGPLRDLPMKLAEQLAELTGSLNHPRMEDLEFQGVIDSLVSQGNDVMKLRETIGVGKGEIGEFRGDDAISKIWEIIGPACGDISCDQYFGFEPVPGVPTESASMYESVIRCCAVLDILGFQSEKKCRKLDQISNVRSDAIHIAMGAFCSAVLSADKRLVRRANAIYRYKSIPSAAFLYVRND